MTPPPLLLLLLLLVKEGFVFLDDDKAWKAGRLEPSRALIKSFKCSFFNTQYKPEYCSKNIFLQHAQRVVLLRAASLTKCDTVTRVCQCQGRPRGLEVYRCGTEVPLLNDSTVVLLPLVDAPVVGS